MLYFVGLECEGVGCDMYVDVEFLHILWGPSALYFGG